LSVYSFGEKSTAEVTEKDSEVQEFRSLRVQEKKRRQEKTGDKRRGTQEHSQEWLCHKSGRGEFGSGRVKEWKSLGIQMLKSSITDRFAGLTWVGPVFAM
jgi:hypothetical protein